MIKHFIEDNKIVFIASLTLRQKNTDTPIEINSKSIERYIKENNIEVGAPIDTKQVAGNWRKEILEARWTYRIPRKVKKRLINAKKSVMISNKPKQRQRPSRARAKQIAAEKRALKEKTNDKPPETKPTRRPRKKSTKS